MMDEQEKFFSKGSGKDQGEVTLEFRFADGERFAEPFINLGYRSYWKEEKGEVIELHYPGSTLMRIEGYNLGELFDAIKDNNVKWVRESNQGDQKQAIESPVEDEPYIGYIFKQELIAPYIDAHELAEKVKVFLGRSSSD